MLANRVAGDAWLEASRYTNVNVDDVPASVIDFTRAFLHRNAPGSPAEEPRLTRARSHAVHNGDDYELEFAYHDDPMWCYVEVFSPTSRAASKVIAGLACAMP